jgi:hypothetical protein
MQSYRFTSQVNKYKNIPHDKSGFPTSVLAASFFAIFFGEDDDFDESSS